MKKNYQTPTMNCLGSIQVLTQTNQNPIFSDVPYGHVGQTGFPDQEQTAS